MKVKRHHLLKSFSFQFALALILICAPSILKADLLDDPSEDVPSTGQGSSGKNSGLIHDDSAKPVPKQKSGGEKKPSVEAPKASPQLPADEGEPSYETQSRPADQEQKPTKKGDKNRNPDSPIKFKGQNFSGDKDGGTMILEDDVIVTQDDLKINADKATIKFDKKTNEVYEVVAVGNVKFFRIDPESGQPVTADSKEAVFNNTSRSVVLKGEPRLNRGGDIVTGKQIIYDLNTGWIKASRVSGVVQPPKSEPKKDDKREDKRDDKKEEKKSDAK